MPSVSRLLQYGVPSPLAEKASAAGLGATKIRSLSQRDLVGKFGLERSEALELKRYLQREAIDLGIVELLLARSNHLCCVCKGEKGHGVILHHIVEYERSQDNGYGNLAVLCPNDHDRAHHSGLTLGLSAEQIRHAKDRWERQVEVVNAQRAARQIQVTDDAVDYVNVMRIEEMCMQRFGRIPPTTISPALRRAGIIDAGSRFDERYVRENLSGGQYLFDYVNSQETEHYRQLLAKLAEVVRFEDLDEAVRSGIRRLEALQGGYAFFIGGVTSKRPRRPISGSVPLEWRYRTTRVELVWHGDAKYLMSSSSISRQGAVNRYLIYGLVRTVTRAEGCPIRVTCSPLLVAQPTTYVDRTPLIAYQRNRRSFGFDDGASEDDCPDSGNPE